MLSNVPFESADSGLTTGIKPFASSFSMTADVDRIDIADESVVHGLARARRHRHRAALVRADQSRIDAGEADGFDVELAADREDARVDEAVEHHGASRRWTSDR